MPGLRKIAGKDIGTGPSLWPAVVSVEVDRGWTLSNELVGRVSMMGGMSDEVGIVLITTQRCARCNTTANGISSFDGLQ